MLQCGTDSMHAGSAIIKVHSAVAACDRCCSSCCDAPHTQVEITEGMLMSSGEAVGSRRGQRASHTAVNRAIVKLQPRCALHRQSLHMCLC